MTAFFIRFYWSFLKLFFYGRLFFVFMISEDVLRDIFRLPYITFNALRMDISTISYLVLPLVLSFLFLSRSDLQIRRRIIGYYSAFVGILSVFLIAVDPFFYKYWGLKVNTLVFEYSEGTKGVMSIAWTDYFWCGLFILFGLAVLRRSLKRLLNQYFGMEILKTTLFIIIFIPLARGGFGKSTVGYPKPRFPEHSYLNACTINPIWNLVANEMRRSDSKKLDLGSDVPPEDALDIEPVRRDLTEFNINDSSRIILLVLESVNTKVSKLHSRYKRDVTPFMDELSLDGVSFSNAYAHSFRSDKGLAALLYGLPTTAEVNPADFPLQLQKQNNLFTAFKNAGYQTQFIHGGDLRFANLHVLLMNVDKVIDESSFEHGLRNTWGFHDEFMYSKALKVLENSSPRSFTVLYTISTHEPFKVPMDPIFKDPYENAVRYADNCLAAFVEGLKSKGLWNNTLLIITSDHGSIQPDHLPAPDENNYRIPMIISGGIAEGKRLLVHEVVSQLDVAFSLSEWCSLGTSFEYNSNLLSPRDIAFYNYFNGLALVRGTCVQWYDLPQSKYLKGPCTESLEKTLFSKAQADFFNPD